MDRLLLVIRIALQPEAATEIGSYLQSFMAPATEKGTPVASRAFQSRIDGSLVHCARLDAQCICVEAEARAALGHVDLEFGRPVHVDLAGGQ